MLRQALGLSALVMLLTAVGCTMCSHPYDYCGPVYDNCGNCGGQPCSLHYRAGSILAEGEMISESDETTASSELAQKPTPQPTKASLTASIAQDQQPNDVDGSAQIVSVTDRVVESAADSAESTQAMTASDDTTSSTGWTARRPTQDLRR